MDGGAPRSQDLLCRGMRVRRVEEEIMPHLSDEEFQAAKEDILEGMAIYYQSYFAYMRIFRGMVKLDMPPEILSEEWAAAFGSFKGVNAEQLMDALLSVENLLEQGKQSPNMDAMLATLRSINLAIEKIRGFVQEGNSSHIPPQPGTTHTHYCPLCEAVYPCHDGPEDCDELPELWCDSCRVKQGGVE